MKIDTEGTYTLRYTAEDECGNVTTEDRTVVVENITYRTVLYTDGTFIINEKSNKIAENVALHGAATNVYHPYNPIGIDTYADRYIFTSPSDAPWYSQRRSVTAVEIDQQISPTKTACWFYDFRICTSIDLTNLDTSNVTSMNRMFFQNWVLESLDVSHFDTSKVTDMNDMFGSCWALKAIDVTHFDTSNVTTMNGMFSSCRALESIDVTHFDTSNVTNMGLMFNQCWLLTTIDVSNFNTSKVTNMQSMFSECKAVTTFDLTSFSTSAVQLMNQMFNGCRAATSIDISTFTTEALTNVASMFSSCQALTTIYANSAFDVSNVSSTNIGNTFMYCNQLVGGAGTAWDSSNIDGTYARVDNPPTAPGYFTLKSA